jgi:hypothetical protein
MSIIVDKAIQTSLQNALKCKDICKLLGVAVALSAIAVLSKPAQATNVNGVICDTSGHNYCATRGCSAGIGLPGPPPYAAQKLVGTGRQWFSCATPDPPDPNALCCTVDVPCEIETDWANVPWNFDCTSSPEYPGTTTTRPHESCFPCAK